MTLNLSTSRSRKVSIWRSVIASEWQSSQLVPNWPVLKTLELKKEKSNNIKLTWVAQATQLICQIRRDNHTVVSRKPTHKAQKAAISRPPNWTSIRSVQVKCVAMIRLREDCTKMQAMSLLLTNNLLSIRNQTIHTKVAKATKETRWSPTRWERHKLATQGMHRQLSKVLRIAISTHKTLTWVPNTHEKARDLLVARSTPSSSCQISHRSESAWIRTEIDSKPSIRVWVNNMAWC